jgi:uncharacterized membrane protein
MPTEALPQAAPRLPRSPGLDAARALAVIAMVAGHTADALLSDSARALPWIQTYWTFRGLTAPMFLFVAGWAVITVVERSGLSGFPLIRARLPRVLLLFAVGVALRWPGWGIDALLAFDRDVWKHFLGFDALHCIAASLMFGVLALSLTRNFWARLGVLGSFAVLIPLVSGAVEVKASGAGLPLLFENALVADARCPFPLFPWSGYFFSGGLTGLLLSRLARQWAKSMALFAAGAVTALAAWKLGLLHLPNSSPVLFAWRLGQVLLIASAMMALPISWSSRLSPIGKSSLVVYVAHLPVVYGWSTFTGLSGTLGRRLSPWQVLIVAGALLLLGLAVASGIRRAQSWIREVRGGKNARSPAVG